MELEARGWQCCFEMIRDGLDVLVFLSFGCVDSSHIIERFCWSLRCGFISFVCVIVRCSGVSHLKGKITLGDFLLVMEFYFSFLICFYSEWH